MKSRSLLVAAASGTLALATALPAWAAPGDTGATVTVTAGGLAITVPSGPTNLGTRANSVNGGTISGRLGVVAVSDARGGVAGWVASVISTAFAPPSGPPIPASAVGYTVGTITPVGIAVHTANNPGNLTDVSPAVTATAVVGDNSATWNPTINVAVPGGMAPATYTATITHSVT